MPLSPDEWAERVRTDRELRDILRLLAGRTPLSRFMGREPSTTYEHLAGLVVRATREPEWTDDDRMAALAYQAWADGLCPGCHSPLDETTAPDAEDDYVEGLAVRCHRCTARERGSERYSESPQPSALLIPVTRREAS